MDELMTLQYNYSKNYREVFEDLATLLFCTQLSLSSGVNRRINQKGIESDPVCIGDKYTPTRQNTMKRPQSLVIEKMK